MVFLDFGPHKKRAEDLSPALLGFQYFVEEVAT